MINPENFKSEIFSLQSSQFNDYALRIYNYQFENNIVYKRYCQQLNRTPIEVKSVNQIPFLPIEFFKTQKVVTGDYNAEKIFKSSGTTQQQRSHHFVKDLTFYHHIAQHTFERFYGSLSDYEILALLPSYQEQGDSSLISMVDFFMSKAAPTSKYFLNKPQELVDQLNQPKSTKRLIIGVSYALLDLVEHYQMHHPELIVMETGGMKGRRKEMIREELHAILKKGFGVASIHSEYGMSELTSQAYSIDGTFKLPDWARIVIRDTNDPLALLGEGKTGGINIIDLANIHSCSFIETKDLGKINPNGTFEVLGRFDNSDIRGCNLLVS
ncbi:MAG: acyl transferase [Flammeovirgaceae bacterium]|nr:acyl transferase [Flammeovirgaceae bacterium]